MNTRYILFWLLVAAVVVVGAVFGWNRYTPSAKVQLAVNTLSNLSASKSQLFCGKFIKLYHNSSAFSRSYYKYLEENGYVTRGARTNSYVELFPTEKFRALASGTEEYRGETCSIFKGATFTNITVMDEQTHPFYTDITVIYMQYIVTWTPGGKVSAYAAGQNPDAVRNMRMLVITDPFTGKPKIYTWDFTTRGRWYTNKVLEAMQSITLSGGPVALY